MEALELRPCDVPQLPEAFIACGVQRGLALLLELVVPGVNGVDDLEGFRVSVFPEFGRQLTLKLVELVAVGAIRAGDGGAGEQVVPARGISLGLNLGFPPPVNHMRVLAARAARLVHHLIAKVLVKDAGHPGGFRDGEQFVADVDADTKEQGGIVTARGEVVDFGDALRVNLVQSPQFLQGLAALDRGHLVNRFAEMRFDQPALKVVRRLREGGDAHCLEPQNILVKALKGQRLDDRGDRRDVHPPPVLGHVAEAESAARLEPVSEHRTRDAADDGCAAHRIPQPRFLQCLRVGFGDGAHRTSNRAFVRRLREEVDHRAVGERDQVRAGLAQVELEIPDADPVMQVLADGDQGQRPCEDGGRGEQALGRRARGQALNHEVVEIDLGAGHLRGEEPCALGRGPPSPNRVRGERRYRVGELRHLCADDRVGDVLPGEVGHYEVAFVVQVAKRCEDAAVLEPRHAVGSRDVGHVQRPAQRAEVLQHRPGFSPERGGCGGLPHAVEGELLHPVQPDTAPHRLHMPQVSGTEHPVDQTYELRWPAVLNRMQDLLAEDAYVEQAERRVLGTLGECGEKAEALFHRVTLGRVDQVRDPSLLRDGRGPIPLQCRLKQGFGAASNFVIGDTGANVGDGPARRIAKRPDLRHRRAVSDMHLSRHQVVQYPCHFVGMCAPFTESVGKDGPALQQGGQVGVRHLPRCRCLDGLPRLPVRPATLWSDSIEQGEVVVVPDANRVHERGLQFLGNVGKAVYRGLYQHLLVGRCGKELLAGILGSAECLGLGLGRPRDLRDLLGCAAFGEDGTDVLAVGHFEHTF